MAHVGFHVSLGRVYALPRALRALAYKKNVVPASMLASRRDTPKRVAAYLNRGLGPYYLPDDKASLDASCRLHEEFKEHDVFEKKLMNLSVFGWGAHFDMDAVTSTMASDNTSYASWNVPQMVHLTSAGIRSFFAASVTGCL